MPRRRKGTEREKNSKVFGARLAALRKERGITQVELAARLGVGQALVSHLENGRRNFDAQLIVDLARILGVSADELLGLGEPEKTRFTVLRPFLRRLQNVERLSQHDRKALLRTIDAFLAKAS